MKTVTFGNKNSYADFGLILDHKEIGKPEPRTNYIDVPARDGHLDLTEAFGEVKYKERKLKFFLSYIGSDANWESTLSALHNYLNGQRHKIYFEKDYYWVGRCFVDDAQTKKGIKEFVVECDCEPYKYKLQETSIDVLATNTTVIKTIINDRKTATPQIKVLSGSPILSWTDAKTGVSYQNALTSDFDNKNGFTVLRLLTMAGGMMNAEFTKEELLDLNKKLNKIRKPR